MPNIPVHALEEPEYREVLKSADIIYGVDVNSRHEFLLFGREQLQRIVDSGVTEQAAVAKVELDHDTDELEWVIAAVTVLKGHHDYEVGGNR